MRVTLLFPNEETGADFLMEYEDNRISFRRYRDKGNDKESVDLYAVARIENIAREGTDYKEEA
jgi:hypothetical protein